MQSKSPTAYKTIGEVSELLNLPTHVLRFWEKKFDQITPYKNNGRRYYTPQDISIVENIQFLLHEKGFTITGVKAHLAEQSRGIANGSGQVLAADSEAALKNILQILKNTRSQLQEALGE